MHRTVEASRRASALAIGVFSIISNFLLTTFPISRLISRRRLRHPCHGSQYFAKVPVPMQLEVPVTRYLPHRAIIWNHFASDGASRHGGTGADATENFGPKCKYDNSAGHQTVITAKATPDHKGTPSSCLIRNNSRTSTAVAWISSPAWIASPLLMPPRRCWRTTPQDHHYARPDGNFRWYKSLPSRLARPSLGSRAPRSYSITYKMGR